MLVMISIGLTLIFGFLRVLNFAHGAFYMLGGYVVFHVIDGFGSFWLGLLVAPIAVGVIAIVVERLLLRPTYDLGPITQVIITIGLTYVIEGLVVYIWGPSSKNINIPSQLTGSVDLLGISYPSYRAFITVVGVVTILATWSFLRYTDIGLAIRASLTDKQMARALGYDIPFIYTLVFTGGVMIAALAGALMLPLDGVSPQTGGTMLLPAFIVVVVGGLGSFRGTIVAGLGIGLTDIMVARYVAFQYADVSIFGILLLVLIVKPNGIFGAKDVFD
jgi:branched-subunit amino acid ABC-type transport system permease component